MAVFCPKHHLELNTTEAQFSVPQNPTFVVVGTCPKCNIKYINRCLSNSSMLTISGTRYLFLQELATEYPYDIKNDARHVHPDQSTCGTDLSNKKTAHTHTINPPIKSHTPLSRKERQQKERLEAQREMLIQNANSEYVPISVAYCDELPESCLLDSTSLVLLSNIRLNGREKCEGMCCPRCGRVYMSKSYAPKHKRIEKSSSEKKASASKNEVSSQHIKHADLETMVSADRLDLINAICSIRQKANASLNGTNQKRTGKIQLPNYYSAYLEYREKCAKSALYWLQDTQKRSSHKSSFEDALIKCYRLLIGNKTHIPLEFSLNLLQEIAQSSKWDQEKLEDYLERKLIGVASAERAKEKNDAQFSPVQDSTVMSSQGKTPESAILVATVSNDATQKRQRITIVSNEQDQNSAKDTYWVGRTFPSLIMLAVRTSPDRAFSYKNTVYRVTAIKKFKNTPKYLDIISRFCNRETPQTVYVFSQKNIERYKGADYEEVTAMIPCANSTFPAPISVVYEKKTQTYFINEVSYDIARARYGLPYLRLREVETSKQGFGQLRAQSMLNRLGYNVSAAENLRIEVRRRMLQCAIDTGTLSKAEVVNHLEWLINTRRNMDNMENAIGEWKADLQYISTYQLDKQRSIWAKTFTPKYPR